MPRAKIPEQIVRALPKVELHVHLDGAVRTRTILDLARDAGVELPADDEAALRKHVQVSPRCRSLAEFLARFDVFMPCLSTAAAMERIAYELVEDKAREGVRYVETRFAPLLQEEHGLPMEGAVEAVLAGLRRGQERHGVRSGLILCGIRNKSPDTTERTVRVAAHYRDQGVLGIDLAGDERDPARPHAGAFGLARSLGLAITCHAGEAGPAENIREALDLGATRIGHGVRLGDDPDLLARVRHEGIVLEMCPTSNLQTRAVRTLREHPLKRFLAQGLRVTVSTDDPRVSGDIDLTGEYLLAARMGVGLPGLRALARTAAEAAFIDGAYKAELVREVERGIAAA